MIGWGVTFAIIFNYLWGGTAVRRDIKYFVGKTQEMEPGVRVMVYGAILESKREGISYIYVYVLDIYLVYKI